MALKLTKNELKIQKDSLKQFQRFLPTLQLKKQMLQSVMKELQDSMEALEREKLQKAGNLEKWIAVFAENKMFDFSRSLENLVEPEKVVQKKENIAGIFVPVFEELTFKEIEYDTSFYPLWVDTAVFALRDIAVLDAKLAVLKTRFTLLHSELQTTTQRVNLFEKVKIPQAKANIRKINIFLADQQTSAVVRGKIAKKKTGSEVCA